MKHVLVDTGPLVALLNARDEFHEWTRVTLDDLEPPLHTCDAVLAETSHLVRKLPGGPRAVLELVNRGVLEIAFRVDADVPALQALLRKYASVPMSLADACLVRMVELDPSATVLTLDSDFRVYRRAGRLVIPMLMPETR